MNIALLCGRRCLPCMDTPHSTLMIRTGRRRGKPSLSDSPRLRCDEVFGRLRRGQHANHVQCPRYRRALTSRRVHRFQSTKPRALTTNIKPAFRPSVPFAFPIALSMLSEPSAATAHYHTDGRRLTLGDSRRRFCTIYTPDVTHQKPRKRMCRGLTIWPRRPRKASTALPSHARRRQQTRNLHNRG